MTPRNSKTINGLNIYKKPLPHTGQTSEFLGFWIGQTKADMQKAGRSLVPSTHIGQVRWTGTHWEYSTTIGVYLAFEPVKRVIEGLSDTFEVLP